MKAFRIAVLMGLVGVACSLTWATEEKARILTPEDDLPTAIVGDYRVDFTRNGAFVVSRNGRYLFDGGLIHAVPEWSEWGTQIRRSDHSDSWELDPQHRTRLVTRGTLFDLNRNERFAFVQQVEPRPRGLRFSYDVTPLAQRELANFGLVLHFPIAETANRWVTFWPGFHGALMPAEFQAEALESCRARAATIWTSDRPRLAVVGDDDMDWTVHDDRRWGLNTFRLIGSHGAVTESLGRGDSASFSFEVLLGGAVSSRLPLGPGGCESDRYGRFAIFLGGTKIAEGGLAWEGEPVRWLYETAAPADARPSEMSWEVAALSNAADGQGTSVTYSMGLRAESDAEVAVTYTVLEPAREQLRGSVKLLLAVPASEVVSAPATETSDDAVARRAQGAAQRGGLRHTTQVAYRSGATLQLMADQPWAITEATVSEQECHMLSISTHKTEDGGLTASVRLRLVMGQTTGNGRLSQ